MRVRDDFWGGVVKATIALCTVHLCCLAASAQQVRLDVVARVPIGHKGDEVALSPDGAELYIAQDDSHSIAVLNTRTRKLVRTIHVTHAPGSLAVSPDGRRVYVGQWAGQLDGQLSVIDTATNAVRPVYVGGPVPGLALSADGRTLYLAMCRSGLRKMDTQTGAVQVIYRQFCPWGVAVSPDQKSVWVNFQGGGPSGRRGHDSIAKFEAATGKLIGVVAGPPNVGGRITASRDGTTVWADGLDACFAAAYDHAGCPAVPAGVVNVIDAANARLLRTLPRAQYGTIALSASQRIVALAGTHVAFIDTRDFHLVAHLAEEVFDLAFSADDTWIYATSIDNPEVIVVRVRRG